MKSSVRLHTWRPKAMLIGWRPLLLGCYRFLATSSDAPAPNSDDLLLLASCSCFLRMRRSLPESLTASQAICASPTTYEVLNTVCGHKGKVWSDERHQGNQISKGLKVRKVDRPVRKKDQFYEITELLDTLEIIPYSCLPHSSSACLFLTLR